MGHTLDQWQSKVAELVRDVDGTDLTASQIIDSGIALAIAEYSTDRPLVVVTEAAGAGSSYLDMPAGWLSGFSALVSVEYPARLNPPRLLDPQSWVVVRDPADVSVEQLLLNVSPAAGEYVRFSFTTRWPMPTGATDPVVDLIDDISFEAVRSLAASYCCISLVGEAARNQHASLPADWTDTRDRGRDLLEAAKAYRATYERFMGLDDAGGSGDGGGSSGEPPASGFFDFDPSAGSIFHGGRR